MCATLQHQWGWKLGFQAGFSVILAEQTTEIHSSFLLQRPSYGRPILHKKAIAQAFVVERGELLCKVTGANEE